jgi:hypothetical protein
MQEILVFKTWVKGCLKDGPEIFVGHTYMHLFDFLLIPLGDMLCNTKCPLSNALWSPKDGPPI